MGCSSVHNVQALKGAQNDCGYLAKWLLLQTLQSLLPLFEHLPINVQPLLLCAHQQTNEAASTMAFDSEVLVSAVKCSWSATVPPGVIASATQLMI